MVPLQLLVASALVWTGEPSAEILDFTAVWCGPCQQVSKVVSKLQRDGVPIRKVDIDQEPALKSQYNIRSIPAFVLLIDGKEVARAADFKENYPAEAGLRRLCAMLPQATAEPKTTPRQSARVRANEVDLGAEAPLPQTAPVQKTPEKPGALARFFGGKKKEAPAAPTAARAQGDDGAAVALARQPSTPLAATVRLRVKDSGGDNVGTGTIIDSRPGQTLILTCGHIFRQWAKGSQVYVDLFYGEQTTEIVGKLVRYELDDKKGVDIGLVSISTDQPLPACRVAPSGTGILAGASVASVGCGGGERPTVQNQKITAINRHKTNDIECSALPEGGRSGGGLFDRNGRVIGICMCADPKYREGIYADLKAIHTFLNKQGLSRVYGGEPPANEEPQLADAAGSDAEVATDDGQSADLGAPAEERTRRPAKPLTELAAFEADVGQLTRPSVSQEDVVGSEVVIIINSKGKNGAPSKVVRLHRASRGFWDNLVPELDAHEFIQETTIKTAARKPVQRSERRQARRPATVDPQASAGRSFNVEVSADEPQAYRRQRPARSEELLGATR